MNTQTPVATFWRRMLTATLLWLLFRPVLRFLQLGDISAAEAFFWITGVLNYPVAISIYATIDGCLANRNISRWRVFLTGAAIAAASVPLCHDRIGFQLEVFVDAWLF